MEYFCRPINLSISAVNEENALTLDIAQDVMHFCLCSKEPCKHLSDLEGKGKAQGFVTGFEVNLTKPFLRKVSHLKKGERIAWRH